MSLVKATYTVKFDKAGAVATGANSTTTTPLPFPADLVEVQVYANTAPTGATLIVNLQKNGTNVFASGSEPTLAVSTKSAVAKIGAADAAAYADVVSKGSKVGRNYDTSSTDSLIAGTNYYGPVFPDTAVLASFAQGDLLALNVTQVGSTVAGSDLSVICVFEKK
jgi:hypothetical protein